MSSSQSLSPPSPPARVHTVAVIGAGSSGITAVKALRDAGLEVTALEASDRVGGNWAIDNPNGMSAAYETLFMNTSRERMQYSEFPIDPALPDFPRHDQVAQYFNDYVDHFGLRDHLRFDTVVQHVQALPGGGFTLTTVPRQDSDRSEESGTTESFDAVVVANGHHWLPRWPDPMPQGADSFTGQIMHAHEYRTPQQLAGKRVVVVGLGNSATDISVDASYLSASTTLSVRGGAHVVPKYLLGKPFDQVGVIPGVSDAVRWAASGPVLAALTGPMTKYGLPRPDHRLGGAHPTVSNRILDRLAHEVITVKPTIERFEGSHVVFSDGSRQEADLVVYCTGYTVAMPFLDAEVMDPSGDNRVRLYQRVFHPRVPGLSVVGLVQPLGAVMPLAEEQSRLVAEQLTGIYQLPPAEDIDAEIDAYEAWLARRFVTSTRHTLEVDFDDYLRRLRRERRRGARRAAGQADPDRRPLARSQSVSPRSTL